MSTTINRGKQNGPGQPKKSKISASLHEKLALITYGLAIFYYCIGIGEKTVEHLGLADQQMAALLDSKWLEYLFQGLTLTILLIKRK